jgi:hypothetical protein
MCEFDAMSLDRVPLGLQQTSRDSAARGDSVHRLELGEALQHREIGAQSVAIRTRRQHRENSVLAAHERLGHTQYVDSHSEPIDIRGNVEIGFRALWDRISRQNQGRWDQVRQKVEVAHETWLAGEHDLTTSLLLDVAIVLSNDTTLGKS